MAVRIGINGFGRIGRQVFKAIHDFHPDALQVVAVNDLTDPKTNAHLLKYDSTYGAFPGDIRASDDTITVDGQTIKVLAQRDPAQIPWRDLGVEIVVESTGLFTAAEKARAHIDGGGAKKVVITAPAKGEDFTVVIGVNDSLYDPASHHVISNASCTTNCIAPVVKVLHDTFGVDKGFMTTIHAYTNDQVILDTVHKDLRRARSAGLNIIPTTTGAARAVTLVMPELKGRLDGMAFRVPTPTVSVCDFVATLEKPATVEAVNEAFRDAASESLRGILEYCDEPLVSSDFKGNPASSIFDSLSTMVLDGNLVKAISWYDNEWGYACRTADLCAFLASKGL
ncbi:MAG: type I glyceraldehyde-3-phosphate dehydrogenase, partial [Dehalococcoidia bacterium]|nr:type I glyceraldehyde-3-phosphate dehydrogenase [Dehalococcoidia bacterium]